MTEFQPKVSIVIPVYNGSDFMREAIDSALSQTYRNREILVVNDGSMDGGKTEEIAKSYGERIRYIAKENGGVSSALNAGVREMTGEYFSWLSHDDVYMPDKLEVQVNALQNYAGKVILYGDYYVIDGESKLRGLHRVQHVSPDHFLYALITSSPVNGCTTLIPRSCFDDVGLFDERLKTTQDYDMWARLSKKYKFIPIRKAVVKYRVHRGQGSNKMSVIQLQEANIFFTNCLDVYSVGEIFGPRKSSVTMSYLSLAANFKARGFMFAFDRALQLAHDHVSKFGMAGRSYEHLLLFLLRTTPKAFLSPYWKLIYQSLIERMTLPYASEERFV